MQPRVGESCRPATLHLVLPAKPLAEPMPRVAVNGTVGRAHRAETEVVRPTQKHPVQSRHSVLDRRPQPSTVGQLADLVLEGRRSSSPTASSRCRSGPSAASDTARSCSPGSRTSPRAHGTAASWSRSPSTAASTSSIRITAHRLVGGAAATDHESSSPGEFHPQALTEPDGSLSAHPALITRPGLRLPAKFLPIAGLT